MKILQQIKEYILTFGQSGHQLKSTSRSQINAGPFQLIIVQEGAGVWGISALRHMSHFHWSASQLKPIKLFQSLLSTFGISKLGKEES